MKVLDMIHILESKYGWNEKSQYKAEKGFTETQKLIIEDVLDYFQKENRKIAIDIVNMINKEYHLELKTVDSSMMSEDIENLLSTEE